MDVTTHESARGEGPAVWGEDEAGGNPEGVKPPEGAWATESPSRLEGVGPEELLDGLAAAEEEDAGVAEDFSAEGVDDAGAEDEAGAERRPPQRLSVRGLPAEQQYQLAEALDLVRRGEAGDVMEALEKMKGGDRTSEVRDRRPDEEGVEADRPGEAGDLKEMKERIAALRGQRREAIEDFDRAAEARLTEEIEDLQGHLWRAEQAVRVQEEQGQGYQKEYHAAVDAMEERYPETRDENSAFFKILDNKIAAAQARQDPALEDPGFILHFADEVAGMLGGHRAGRTPGRGRVPVGSALAPGYQTAARPGKEQLSRMIREMPLEDLERLVCTE